MPARFEVGAVEVHLEELLAERAMTLTELAKRIGLTQANLSILKTGKAKAIRFSTLAAICTELDCQPGELLTFVADPNSRTMGSALILVDVGPKEISVLKVLRQLFDLSLKEAKAITGAELPKTVEAGMTRVDAESAMVRLRAAGARAEIS